MARSLSSPPAIDRVGRFSISSWKVADFVDWYLHAIERGVRERMLDEIVLHRRIHEANSGRRNRDARVEYAQVLGAALRRRRSA